MSLKRLEYFVAVAEELSFTGAARRLHMAQPPLSTQVRDLERELGTPLLRREGRGIALTPAGRALLPEARRLLGRYDELGRLARRAEAGESGRLAIGLVPSAANGGLPAVLRAFGDRHPAVEIALVEDRPPQLLRLLAAGDVDVVLQYGHATAEGVVSHPVAVEDLVLALPPEHPLAALRRVPVTRLHDEPLILPPRHAGDGLHDRITRLLAEHGVSVRVVHGEVWLMQTIAGLVSAGLGAAVVPSSTAQVRPDEVAYRTLGPRRATVTLEAVWRAADRPPPVAAFVALWPRPDARRVPAG